VQQKLFAIGL